MIEIAGGILIAGIVVLLVLALVRNPGGFLSLLGSLVALGCMVGLVAVIVGAVSGP